MAEKSITLAALDDIHAVFGDMDGNVSILQKEYNVRIFSRDGDIKISGQDANVDMAYAAIESLLALLNKGEEITDQSVRYVISMVNEGKQQQLEGLGGDVLDKWNAEYYCDCSRERTKGILMSLGKEEIEKLASEQKETEVCCHFCNKRYVFTADELLKMLKE